MIFLVTYDTNSAKLLEIKEYDDSSRAEAVADLRNKQEALLGDLNRIEVGLFEAESRAMLERTHSRYFKSLTELRESVAPKKSA